MSKIFDNIETKFEEGLHAIPGSGDRTGLLPVGDMSFKSPKKAGELAVCGSVHVYPTMGKL